MPKNTPSPVVFLTFANDSKGAFLEALKPEQNGINSKLASFQKEGGIVHNAGSGIDEIMEGLNAFKGQISIFHFSGHSDGESLQLEGSDKEMLQGNDLISILKEEVQSAPKLKLVFLNACNSDGILEALKAIKVPAVILTDEAIPDRQAKQFSIALYRSLASGNTLETAFNQAKTVISTKDTKSQVFRKIDLAYLKKGKKKEGIPWGLHIQDEKVLRWKIMGKDPLADLPDVPQKYYLKLPKEPFINLRHFKKEHAGIFFGRGQEIAELYQKIEGEHPIILFHGQTGVGKSSLLEAGLLPRLEEEYQLQYVRRAEEGAIESLQAIFKLETAEGIYDAWIKHEKDQGKALIIILDQLEETFTKKNLPKAQAELNELFRILAECFDGETEKPKGKIILSYRKEYHPEIEELAYEFNLTFTELFLKRLSRAGIVEAIEGITENSFTQEKYGLQILDTAEGDLGGIIADDLLEDAESALAPALQILLSRMWKEAKNAEFSIALYQDLKKEGYLLQDFFHQQMETLETKNPEAVQSGLALDVLYAYTTKLGTATSHEDHKLKETYPHLGNKMDALLKELENLYLLTDKVKSRRSLSHDTLAPIIQKEHKDSDKPGQRAYRILESKMLNSTEETGILDEEDLSTVEAGKTGMRAWMKEEERLITDSQTAREKRKKRNRIILGLGIAAIIVILSISGVAAFLGVDGIERGKDGASALLAANSKDQRSINSTRSLRLAEAAYAADSLSPDPKVVTNLFSAYYQPLLHKKKFAEVNFIHAEPVQGAVFSQGEDKVLSWSYDGSVKLWDVSGKELAATEHESRVQGAVFSQGEDKILSWSRDRFEGKKGSIKLWDVSGKELATMEHESYVQGAVFSQGEDKILSWSDDGTVKLWDVSGKELAAMEHESDVQGAVFSQGEDKILSWSDDGTVKLWGVSGKELAAMEHESDVQGAVFSQGEDKILSWSDDGSVKLWDVLGKELAAMEHENSVLGAVFSQGEDKILSWSYDGSVKLWDVSGKELAAMEHERSVLGAVFSQGEDKILSWSYDGSVKLWDVLGKELAAMEHESIVQGAVFSQGEDKILSWSSDGSVKLWDVSGKELAAMEHERSVLGAVFSQGEDKILSWSIDGSVKLWDVLGKELAAMEHESYVDGAVFSQGEDKILSWSSDGSVKLWDVSGKELATMEHENIVQGAVFNQGEDKILSWSGKGFGSKGSVKLWDVSGKELAAMEHESDVLGAVFSQGEDKILSWSFDGSVKLWDVSGKELAAMEHENSVQGAVFSQGEDKILSWSSDGSVKLWDVLGKELAAMEHERSVLGAVFSQGEDKILSWSENGSVKLWDVSGKELAAMEHERLVLRAVFSQGEDKILSWSSDGSVKLWDVSGKELAAMEHERSVRGAVFSQGEDKILSWSEDGSVKLWDVLGKELAAMEHESYVDGAVFSQGEDKILSWSFDGSVKLWDVLGKELAAMEHESIVLGAIFNQGEDKILSWSEDGSVKLWDVSGKELATMEHERSVLGEAVFSQGEDKILSWSENGSVKLWDVSGKELATMEHESYIYGAVFSQGEDKILSWSEDGKIRIWLTPEALFKYLRTVPIAPLSDQEKEEYGIPKAYRKGY
ncbi:MAG: CHAT domain-containing protein [Bacteroidia bacterium]|nr:CHAT domain-containing protein [Bacteroidia bacterium]